MQIVKLWPHYNMKKNLFIAFIGLASLSQAFEVETSITNSENHQHKIVHAEAIFSQSTECVWEQIKSPEKFPSFMPKVSKTKYLGKENEKEKYFVVLNPPFPFKDIINVVSVHYAEEKKEITWEMIDGNIQKNDGKVTLIPNAKNTKIIMDVLLDFGGAWPKNVVAWGVKYYLPKILKSIDSKLNRSDCKKNP